MAKRHVYIFSIHIRTPYQPNTSLSWKQLSKVTAQCKSEFDVGIAYFVIVFVTDNNWITTSKTLRIKKKHHLHSNIKINTFDFNVTNDEIN